MLLIFAIAYCTDVAVKLSVKGYLDLIFKMYYERPWYSYKIAISMTER